MPWTQYQVVPSQQFTINRPPNYRNQLAWEAVCGIRSGDCIIEALHGSHIDDIGAIHLPHIGILTSLGFIAATLFVTTVASLIRSSCDRRVKIDD